MDLAIASVVAQDIRRKRLAIMGQLEKAEDKKRAEYLFQALNDISLDRYALVHSFFAGLFCCMVLVLWKIENDMHRDYMIFAVAASMMCGVVVHKLLKLFYYSRKIKAAAKELGEELSRDCRLGDIFWLIEKEGHPFHINQAKEAWSKILKLKEDSISESP
jgi:hypothetical protein